MEMTHSTTVIDLDLPKSRTFPVWLSAFFIGALIPFGFAPFHLPGLSILGILLFYLQLQKTKQPLRVGFAFGLGYFGVGVSWVYVSIHAYGHLHPLLSVMLTFLFVSYLACYFAVLAWGFKKGERHQPKALWFSVLWVVLEYARSSCFTGFPWLLIGVGQFDAPTKSLIPIIGVYGTSFVACLAATCLAHAIQLEQKGRFLWLVSGLALLLSPTLLKTQWVKETSSPIPVALLQSNLSMRDKWDENLFWSILQYYRSTITPLLGTPLIVLPESAIPLPSNYVHDYLEQLQQDAKQKHSAVLFGIPAVSTYKPEAYYNGLMGAGVAHGYYLKKHLVPFGEYIPRPFTQISQWLGYPEPNIYPGPQKQPLIMVKNYPIATLICYELAYDQLLREQLPQAAFIVSISDDGWFGHSLAMYQQQQIAQVRSLQTGRYQIVSNNDGLSAILNTQGEIEAALPGFSRGVLKGSVKPATGETPWVTWGDWPVGIFLFFCLLLRTVRRYPYQPV